MRNLMLGIIVCVAMMIGGTGCEEGLTPTQVQALAAQQVLQQQVDAIQTVATQLTQQLAVSKIVDQKIVDKVAALNEETDKVQTQIATITLALKDVPLTGDTNQDWIAMLQAANVVSGEFNPYVVPVGTALTIASLLLGWIAKRNAAEAAANKAKYQAHKEGVELTMKEVSANKNETVREIETRLYDNIGNARVANHVA